MKLELTTWQRVTLLGMVGKLRGGAALMKKALKLLECLDFTDEERERVNMRTHHTAQGEGLIWDDVEHRWSIEVADKEAGHLLRRLVEGRRDWEAANAREVLDLYEQMQIDPEEEESQK